MHKGTFFFVMCISLNEVIIILKFLKRLFSNFYIFTASYSNNIFPQPLSKEEEEETLLKANMGDKEARCKLIEHNLRLVAHIVKKYDYRNEDMDDLISIGTVGLIKGVDSYSSKHKTRLTTYCARCIENEILMYFRSNKKNNKNVSIDEAVGYDKEGNVITLLDILKTKDPDFAMELHREDNLKYLSKYFKILTDREKDIIIKRYGLDGKEEITQREIARKLGISRSYVSRIEKRALTKMLREFMKDKRA